MYIFNTTYLVSDKMHGTWVKWLNEIQIPRMIDTGLFTKPQVAKVLSDEVQDGTSFSVQFHFPEIHLFALWSEQFSEDLQQDILERFGTEVLSFSVILEII